MTDTIFALSSGAPPSGIAVIRISGPAAGPGLLALAGRLPEPRRASRARLVDPATGELLDDALVLWFPGPRSETGEDLAELHVHGGRAVLAGVFAALAARPGLRPAERGEFARRAFDHGKLDLTAAEGLADLVAAETAAQRRQALAQLGGALAARVEGWRSRLLGLIAHAEAAIDFPEEALPDDLLARQDAEICRFINELEEFLDDRQRGERVRDGLMVAILGAPNVGKSSLLNRLAGRDAAIVSAHAGTTRDVIEVRLDLEGLPVTLADTAGLRDLAAISGPQAEIEAEGIRRSLARAAEADLKLVVLDASSPAAGSAVRPLVDADALVVLNKTDLTAVGDPGPGVLPVSARTGAGMDALTERLAALLRARLGSLDSVPLTRARHRAALTACRDALIRARTAPLPELAAEDLRLAARALGRITGRIGVEDVLDVIFREFCIGK